MTTTKNDFDKFATEYDFWTTQKISSNKQYIPSWVSVQPTYRVLDVGCGSGKLSLNLARQVDWVVGIDISTHMIALAKQHQHHCQQANVLFMVAAVEQLGFVKQTFDILVSQAALHHTDLDEVLPYLRKLVRPNGRIWIQDIITSDPERWHSLRYQVKNQIQKNLRAMPRLIRHRGLRAAWRITKFRLSPAWLEHRRRDKILSPNQFRQVYARWLPGCHFEEHSLGKMSVFWEAPNA